MLPSLDAERREERLLALAALGLTLFAAIWIAFALYIILSH